MNPTHITITSEQLVKTALQRYRLDNADADILLATVITETHPNDEPATVVRQSVTNSIIDGIRKLERQAAAAEKEFRLCGQMSLFGELIPEHQVPAGLVSKSAAEMNEWMQARAQIERENADEMRRAADAQERKAQRFEQWANSVSRVCHALTDAGFNPQDISYEAALAKAETIHAGTHTASSATTKGQVR
jgi:hypothetical protein